MNINLKKYVTNKNYLRYFEKDKEYVFSYESYSNYCTVKRYHKISMYEKLDNKKVEVEHKKGAKLITGSKGLYPAIIFVRPYWCKEATKCM